MRVMQPTLKDALDLRSAQVPRILLLTREISQTPSRLGRTAHLAETRISLYGISPHWMQHQGASTLHQQLYNLDCILRPIKTYRGL